MDIKLQEIKKCLCSRGKKPWENKVPFQSVYVNGRRYVGKIDCYKRLGLFGLTSMEGISVLDIGCSLGACCIESKLMGAQKIVGIDNDSRTLSCAEKIAAFNNMNDILYVKADINQDDTDSIIDQIGDNYDYIFLFAVLNWIDHTRLQLLLQHIDFSVCLVDVKKALQFDCVNWFNKINPNYESIFVGDSVMVERELWKIQKK